MRKYLIGIILLTTCSCSGIWPFIKKKDSFDKLLEKYSFFQNKDYEDQLESLAQVYINSPGVSLYELRKRDKRYLKDIFDKIVLSNELLIKAKKNPNFFIIKNEAPFYFSLPGGNFFFSMGLFQKYLKNEDVFVAALTKEIIKSLRGIYEKKIIVPIGHIRTEQIITMTRISLEVDHELNRWVFYALKRSNMDPYAYLNWLQIKNKNALDFRLLFGNTDNFTREEFLFKNYITKGNLQERYNINQNANSSPEFYNLLKDLRALNE